MSHRALGSMFDDFDPGDHDPDLAYHMEEPNPPAKLYHVAPRTARSSISQHGLDASGMTHNTGGGEWNPDDEWNYDDYGEGKFPTEYRPEGVYLFKDRSHAKQYNSDGKGDIYEIDSEKHDRPIARDPSVAENWEYMEPEHQTYVTRSVAPEAMRRLT